MPRGRKPASVAHLQKTGNYRQGKHGDRVGSNLPEDDGPVKPKWVSEDAVADAFWDETVSRAIPGVLREMDSASLGGMCRLWSQWRTLDQLYREHPTDKNISVQWRGVWTALEKQLACYGMNPADRQRLKGSSLDASQGDGFHFESPKLAEGT